MTRKISILLIVILVSMCAVAYAEGAPTPAPTSDVAAVDMNVINTIPWWIWTVLVAIGSLLLALKQYVREKKSKKSKN